ncbi:MAG: HAD family phosphatase [Clostridia bacterium]|nr:HAD family phosphatase [Clostridia bacterium]
MKIKGLIFDMDGLLIDTESLSFEALKYDCAERGLTLTMEQFLSIRSLSLPKCEEKFKGYFGDDFDFYGCFENHTAYMNEHIAKHGVPMKKGADSILRFGKEQGLRLALATSTPLEIAEGWLREIGLWEYFDKVQSAANIKHGKPAPDVYLAASELLGLKASECMAFEDSPNGVRSASSAGCMTVMVPDLSGPDQELSKLIFASVRDLDEAVELIKNTQE